MYPLQIICLILDKKKAKAISNFLQKKIADSHWLILLTQSSYTMTLILVERRRGHVGRWSWWREGHVWKDLSSAEAFVGGGAKKSRTSASSTLRPSPAATPLRYCTLLPCSRTEGDGTSIWVMPCSGSLACLLFLACAWRRWPSANTRSTSRASFSGEPLLCKPAAASWCVTSFYSSSSSFDICVARIIVVASRTA